MVQVASAVATDKEALLGGLLRVGDATLAAASGYLAYALRLGHLSPPSIYLAAFLLAALLTLNGMALAGVYRPDRVRRPLRRFARTLTAWAGVAAALALLSVIVKISDSYSRIWFILWILLGAVALFLLRLAVALLVARWRETGEALKRVAILGVQPRARAIARQLAESEGPHLTVVGFVAPGGEPGRGPGLLGRLEALPEIVRRERIEEIIVALEGDDRATLAQLMQQLRGLPITVRFALAPPALELPLRGVSEIGGLPMLDLWRRPLGAWELFVKAAEDRALALLFLVVAAPAMLAIALAIRLDSRGPVLFRQQRAGFTNGPFAMLKFRTMQAAAAAGDGGELPQARRNDPRITRVGAFLRRTSLDELPQLFNVLRGEMSLVGPRPHALAHDRHFAQLIDDYLARQRVKPGMTGWAQVNGLRGETDTPEKMRRRVQHDLFYIDNWSVFLDLKILFLTLFVGFVNRNAY